MTTDDCSGLVDSYVAWLREGLSTARVETGCELTTPFLDRHNDHLQIYAERHNGTIELSDDGYILADLKASGMEIDTPKRREIFLATLQGLGVQLRGDELVVEASEKNLGAKVHALVQGMLAVNDMYVMGQARVAGFFFEDVKAFLDEHDVRYTERIKVPGKSGYDHTVDFLIPRSKNEPERLVQAINAPTKDSIGPYLFGITDTRQLRGSDARAFAFLNDEDHAVAPNVTEALSSYDVVPALWSERELHVAALAR